MHSNGTFLASHANLNNQYVPSANIALNAIGTYSGWYYSSYEFRRASDYPGPVSYFDRRPLSYWDWEVGRWHTNSTGTTFIICGNKNQKSCWSGNNFLLKKDPEYMYDDGGGEGSPSYVHSIARYVRIY